MSRVYALLVSVMLLLTLGLAQAPRVCVGDGLGGACQPEACACVQACSCQEAHRRATLADADCCAVEAASGHDGPASAEASCHGPDGWPHFAPADRHWYALVPAWPLIVLDRPTASEPPAMRARLAHRSHAPPERPPRLLG